MTDLDVAVVGAGFAGLALLHRLRGQGLRTRVFEAGSGVGGTWFWNRYPGARCDVESQDYSYSFSPELEQEWCWSERYPAQPEILAYLDHVADRFGLRPDIALDTRVLTAHFVDGGWNVETTGGPVRARYVVFATGCLSAARDPGIPGLGSFAGRVLRTSNWPAEPVDLAGLRVGVIGTGSSGLQVIPAIAEQAGHTTVFQRTPAFTVPAWNGPIDDDMQRAVKADYPAHRQRARESYLGVERPENHQSALSVDDASRAATYERFWRIGGVGFLVAFDDLFTDADANTTAAEFVRAKIRETVHDPAVADRLSPSTYPIGTRRICVDTGYWATFNRDDVLLVDVAADPIRAVTPTGVSTADSEYPLDALVLATGFDAITGAVSRVDIRGHEGRVLKDEWADGAHTHLGVAVAGYPNLFLVTGPGSPSVLSNMITSIEQHVEWISDLIVYARDRGVTTVEADLDAQERWNIHVDELAAGTLYDRADSWYRGAGVPGKSTKFLPYVGGVGRFRATCQKVADSDYEGFTLT